MSDEAEELKEVFRLFDNDGNGFLSESNLRTMLRKVVPDVTAEECRAALGKLADKDLAAAGEVTISFDEFVDIMSR